MSRAERRAKFRGTPKALRGVPALDIKESDLRRYLPQAQDGDILTIKGFGRGQAGGFVRVEHGNETPIRIKVRRDGLDKR